MNMIEANGGLVDSFLFCPWKGNVFGQIRKGGMSTLKLLVDHQSSKIQHSVNLHRAV